MNKLNDTRAGRTIIIKNYRIALTNAIAIIPKIPLRAQLVINADHCICMCCVFLYHLFFILNEQLIIYTFTRTPFTSSNMLSVWMNLATLNAALRSRMHQTYTTRPRNMFPFNLYTWIHKTIFSRRTAHVDSVVFKQSWVSVLRTNKTLPVYSVSALSCCLLWHCNWWWGWYETARPFDLFNLQQRCSKHVILKMRKQDFCK